MPVGLYRRLEWSVQQVALARKKSSRLRAQALARLRPSDRLQLHPQPNYPWWTRSLERIASVRRSHRTRFDRAGPRNRCAGRGHFWFKAAFSRVSQHDDSMDFGCPQRREIGSLTLWARLTTKSSFARRTSHSRVPSPIGGRPFALRQEARTHEWSLPLLRGDSADQHPPY